MSRAQQRYVLFCLLLARRLIYIRFFRRLRYYAYAALLLIAATRFAFDIFTPDAAPDAARLMLDAAIISQMSRHAAVYAFHHAYAYPRRRRL